jgi:flagellar assembly factor FliW
MTPSPVATLPARASAPASLPAQHSVAARSGVQALSLTEPLPGFPGYRDYVLVPADAAGVLFWLQSLAPEGPRFLAVPAATFFPDYAPTLPGAVLAELGLPDRAAAQLFCLVTVPAGDVAGATANLRAPVVLDRDTRRARQVVLTDGLHPIRRPMRR